jgi:hypothetical protein
MAFDWARRGRGCRAILRGTTAFALGVLVSTRAVAQNEAAAEVLFQQGRELLEQGKIDEACSKLTQSQKLDPATGTLMALALCHEQQGLIAAAWLEFTEVESRARTEGREDRVTLARDRAAALRPRLSTLSIDVSEEVSRITGLDVRRSGQVVPPASFGVPVPTDGGEYELVATAPGRATWTQRVTVKPERDVVRVTVPVLAAGRTETPPAAETTGTDSGDSGAQPAKPGRWMRPVGLGVAGVGLVGIGVGSYLALDAKGAYDDAKKRCDAAGCEPGPHGEVEKAQTQGDLATIFWVAGGAFVAGGAVLWFLAPSSSDEKSSNAAGVRLTRAGWTGAGLRLEGTF